MPPATALLGRGGSRQVGERGEGTAEASVPADTFESVTDHDDPPEIPRTSIEVDDLPIELVSLTDSFIESLFAKVHSVPPNIDNLSRLFQEFYASASSHIHTHISALATKASRSRDGSPARASSTASRLRAKAASLSNKDRPKLLGGIIGGGSSQSVGDTPTSSSAGSQQMLTADELAARKRARRALEQKRILLEEAVERRLCEGLYDRIYRHRTTQDEAQDEKLRSKTAALALVGIGPAELGIHLGDDPTKTPPEVTEDRVEDVRMWLADARTCLVRMHDKRYPLGKLNILKSAHKSIVDTLAHFHPSASADEVMPMLIYTLITMPPENLNVISDARFIQRFRCETKLTGETAYCLTNLEAAISFLETVDLSTLRDDEHPSGPTKEPGDGASTRPETFPPAYPQGLATLASSRPETTPGTATADKPAASAAVTSLRATAAHNRRISDLVNTPALAINAASDAVFSTADQGLRTISSSLDISYKFLFGRLLERNNHEAAASASASASTSDAATEVRTPGIMLPKTLDDARKLISTPPPLMMDDDDRSASAANSVVGAEDTASTAPLSETTDTKRRPPLREDRVLNLIGGWRPSRDHSADSTRSASGSKKVVFVDESKDKALATTPGATPMGTNPAMLESMRNFGNSLNPMARLPGISMIRGFGRSSTSTPTTPMAFKTLAEIPDNKGTFSESTASSALPSPISARTISAPITRFMEVSDAGDLKIAEVEALLRDYRRLASVLKEMSAF